MWHIQRPVVILSVRIKVRGFFFKKVPHAAALPRRHPAAPCRLVSKRLSSHPAPPGCPHDPAPPIVFDLDGTLIDTAPDLLASLNHCLAAEGMAPVQASELLRFVGMGARVIDPACVCGQPARSR